MQLRRAGVIAVAGTIAALLTPSAASAAPVPAAPAAAAGHFCSVSTVTGRMVCVATEAELPSADVQAATPAGSARPAAALDIVTLAYLYVDANYGGDYLRVTGSHACSGSKTDIEAQLSTLGSFNNRVSSFRTEANCGVRFFSNQNYGGAALPASGYLFMSTYLADLNDNAESIRVS